MEDVLVPIAVVGMLFIGMPWLIFHYVTKWKTAPKITTQDESLLDEMHQLSRRLEERLHTVERLLASDNPDWRPGLTETRDPYRLERLEARERDERIERSN